MKARKRRPMKRRAENARVRSCVMVFDSRVLFVSREPREVHDAAVWPLVLFLLTLYFVKFESVFGICALTCGASIA